MSYSWAQMSSVNCPVILWMQIKRSLGISLKMLYVWKISPFMLEYKNLKTWKRHSLSRDSEIFVQTWCVCLTWCLCNTMVLNKLRVGDELHPSRLDLLAMRSWEGNPRPASAVSKETDSHFSHVNAKNVDHFMAYVLHSSLPSAIQTHVDRCTDSNIA